MPTAACLRRPGSALLLALALLAGCRAEEDAPPPARPAPTPEAAVQRLLDDLRRDDLGAYAVHALPPDLYAQVDAAWREGHSRWPLSELPLARRLPAAVDRLAAPGGEAVARRVYREQFRGEARELRSAVRTLGLFARQYLERDADLPAPERAHRLQQLAAVVEWAEAAPLAEAGRVEPLLPGLVEGARASQLAGGDRAWSRLGMHRALTRLRPALRASKKALAALGLDLDATLRGVRVRRISRTADTARMRLHYTLGRRGVVAELDMVRRPEGWFLADSLRHAQASLAPSRPADGAPARVRHNADDGPADAPALPGRPAAR